MLKKVLTFPNLVVVISVVHLDCASPSTKNWILSWENKAYLE